MSGSIPTQLSIDNRAEAGSSRQTPVEPSSATKRTPFVACILCRRCKAKCIRSDPQSPQCDRCKATGCVCEVQSHKRGRPRVRGKDLPKAETVTAGSPLHPFASHQSPENQPGLPDDPHHVALTLAPQSREESEDLSDGDENLRQMPLITGKHRSLSLHHILHPADSQTGGGRPHMRKDQQGPDVVTKGIIHLHIAHTLFDFFFDTLNPIILLFDPVLHTFDYIRSRCTFLFTSILASAAIFIAPVYSSDLARELGGLSVQAILGARRSVEVIQAWMIVYFWKDPRDTRAWTYVGLLCRMAVEIGLNRTPLIDSADPTDLQKRERRNLCRTWMLAYMMDRALASVTGRDWCIRGDDPIILQTRAFSQHPLRVHGDAVIAGFAELRLISSRVTDQLPGRARVVTAEQQHDLARILHVANFDLDDWRIFWEEETAQWGSPPVYIETLRFFELHIRLNLNSYVVNLSRVGDTFSPDVPLNRLMVQAEQYCYRLAMDSLAQLRILFMINERILLYAQDSMSIMVAYAACFLRSFPLELPGPGTSCGLVLLVDSPTFSQEESEQAFRSIESTSQMFQRDNPTENASTPNTKPKTSAELQATFLRSLAAQRPAPDRTSHNTAFGSNPSNSGPGGVLPHSQDTADLMSWFSNTGGTFGDSEAIPGIGVAGPSTGQGINLGMQAGMADPGGQGWDQLLSMWLDVPPYTLPGQ